MLLLTTGVLASTVGNMAWPCTRLNWGWRNVWSTCSINSYIPTNTPNNDHAPAHFRVMPVEHTAQAPATAVNPVGTFQVTATQVPNMLCAALDNTHGGTAPAFSRLRSRCRRAIDAYGGLVRVCNMPPLTAIRGPVASSQYTNFQPLAEHQPHVLNVQALTLNAHHCFAQLQPLTWQSPANTCPGLLGWWGVVWNACGFRTYAPNVAASEGVSAPALAPLGGELSPRFFTAAAVAVPPNDNNAPGFIFCSPQGHGTAPNVAPTTGPNHWNERGPRFRSSRCRRALDQFGRTAQRCGGVTPFVAGQAPIRGSADPLRHLMLGTNAPRGLGVLVPLCN